MAVLAKPSRSAALLRIVRTLIDIGRQRLTAVRSQPGPEESRTIARAFGTFNVALIVARIVRGLRIAAALEDRAIATAPRIDNQGIETPPPARIAASGAPRPTRQPKLSDAEDDAALLARVPTDQEIAAMVRRRPIGAVLAAICADLGIGIDHPLWRELKWVIIDHGGQPEPVMERTFQRLNHVRQLVEKGFAPASLFYVIPEQVRDATGPPPLSLAA